MGRLCVEESKIIPLSDAKGSFLALFDKSRERKRKITLKHCPIGHWLVYILLQNCPPTALEITCAPVRMGKVIFCYYTERH